MKKLNFEKNLEEKELVVWQLRILFPTIMYEDIEKLYYVWKSRDYKKVWIDLKICPNMNSAYALEMRLQDKGLITYWNMDENMNIKKIGQPKKMKGLPKQIHELVNNNSVTINLELNAI
jgi:hypothetical protein